MEIPKILPRNGGRGIADPLKCSTCSRRSNHCFHNDVLLVKEELPVVGSKGKVIAWLVFLRCPVLVLDEVKDQCYSTNALILLENSRSSSLDC